MTELKKIIRKNQRLLDDIEPLPGHLDRFEKKLGNVENIRYIILPVLAAASVAFLITIMLFNLKMSYENEITLGDVSMEYKEAEMYYQNIFLTEYNEFQNKITPSTTLNAYVENELEQMAMAYEQLVDDFRTNPYDTRVISAIIMHYQTKVDFIKKINEQLENNNVRNVTDYNYEGNRI